jgi:3-hydroxyisobutyrate dehydrogenase-like beta-hydroxyacid dehydrogenase
MARKDARLMLEAADAGGVALTLIPAIAAAMDAALARGEARSDWTVLAKDHVR